MKKNAVIETWVQALRSGDYKQGRYRLARIWPDGNIEYCCLGVLCEVSGLQFEKIPIEDGDRADDRQCIMYDGLMSVLPRNVRDLVDMSGEVEHELAEMNDGGGSFPQIAERIEERFLGGWLNGSRS